MSAARDRLALAADLPLEQAVALYREIAPEVGYAKVGLSLFVEHGPAAVEPFRALGAKVFLDLKLHDIPNTVGLAAEKAGECGVALLTVHAQGGAAMVAAAAEGVKRGAARKNYPAPKILAVTVLTSLSDAELAAMGLTEGAGAQVQRLAALAVGAGADGLVCSAQEVGALRKMLGDQVLLCTPGIRPAGASVGDQARVETPASAIREGSSLLVVGRPIYTASDPRRAAQAICAEIETELGRR